MATAWACLAPGLSYPEPTSVTAPAFVVGDEWTFDRTKEMGTTRFVRSRIDLRVDRVDGDAMLVGVKPDGAPADYEDHRLSLDWSQSRVIGGQPTVTARPFRFPMAPGDSWTVEFRQAEVHDGQTNTHWRATYTVVGWTDVTSTTAITAQLLRSIGYSPTITVLSVPVTFASIKNNDIDVFLGNWMPMQEADISRYVADGSVVTVGPNLLGAKYTLAVPAYTYAAGLHDFKRQGVPPAPRNATYS